MKLPRRQLLHLAAGAVALPAMPRVALALDYPTRPVRIIVGFAAGGPADITARLIAQWLSDRLGRAVIVEDRPGAGSSIGIEAVIRAPADGYTLLLASASAVINATLHDNLNFVRDIAPVASISREPLVLVVNPSVSVRTVLEFVAYAKANPGKLSMASGGNGSLPHVAGELFKFMAGVDMVHVPYKGAAPAVTDLLGGQVAVFFAPLSSSIEYIRANKLRAVAVTTATRSAALPDIPTVAEFVPGYEATAWYGAGAPKNTPAEIIEKLNKEINAGLANPKIKERLADLGDVPMPMSVAEFGKFIVNETDKWLKVVKFAGIKPS